MKKFLFKLVIVVGIGSILLVVAAGLLFGPTSRSAIEHGTTYALGVEAQLGQVDAGLGFDNTHLGLVGYDVQNPEGFGGDPFLHVGELSLDLQTMSVLSEAISVPAITLHGLHLRLVQDGKRSNFKEILDHLMSLSTGAPAATPEAAATAATDGAEGAGPNLMVGAIDLRDIRLTVEIHGIPGIELNETFAASDLHIDVAEVVEEVQSMTLARVIGLVVDQLVEHGIAEAGGHVSPEALELLTGGFDGLEGMLEEKVDEKVEELQAEAEDTLQAQKDAAAARLDASLQKEKKKVGDTLKGLLGDG